PFLPMTLNNYNFIGHFVLAISRSTLCTVMAQLTEETQPCFETTIKSKAVSESSNVKFSCVVTGYPAPELTWYKDDMELDRYCGLPKYEIFRNGKIHTLHIYNCTEDDAAIYQASARNNKGIVSCSGVLEVGTMSEFLIHQRFFAKLKQKAENKRRDLEESRRRGKENIQKEQLNVINQERLLRKRRTPAGNDPLSSSPTTQDGEENMSSQGTDEEQPAIIDDKSDNITVQASVGITEMIMENGNEKLNNICDPMELVATKQSSKEKPGEKKMRITNGFDEVGVIKSTQSNRKREDANEGINQAKYLAESVQSQAAEQRQSFAKSKEIMEVDVTPVQEKEQEGELEIEKERLKEEERNRSREIDREKEQERDKDREREKIKQTEQEQRATSRPSTKAASHKEPEPQHKSALTSVLHSLKDIFFGKSKKSTEPAETTKQTSEVIVEIPHEKHLPPSQTPPQESLVHSEASELEAPKLDQESSQMVDLEVKTKSLPQTQDSTVPNDTINSNSAHANKPKDVSPTPEREHIESIGATLSVEQEMPKDMSSPEEVPQIDHSLLFKVSSSQFSLYNLLVLSICSGGLPAAQHMGVIYREYICPTRLDQGSISSASVDGSEKKGEESGGSTPTSTLSCESSPKMKRRDSLTLIPSATPEELASGARRKIYLAKTKSEDEGSDAQGKRDSPYMSPNQARRAAFLQLQSGQQTPPTEKRSPLPTRRKATLEVPKPKEEMAEVTDSTKTENKPVEKEKLDPFKAPQVIRKIRGEPFSDASGHLKLWCQFFNILSDSTIKWYRDEEEIVEMQRCAGDESPVALAIVHVSSRDCGVYGCSIKNEYGTDITDYLLSAEILAEFFLREDLEVGEEIEMTPMMFTKGLADSGYWGDRFFGRIMTAEVQIGEGCVHKTCRAKVIYGLDPVFESGSTCITKVRNPITYGTKEESNLVERNLEITKQDCKIQNTVREYCKIFAAEARVIENFGFSLEVIPLHLMYRPANTIPYATVETDLKGVYVKYCLMDSTGRLIARATSEVEQKCCTFQHWIHQWTNGNLLVTRIEGVDTKITSIEIVTKSKGYQGLTDKGSPNIIEQFVTQHQCNYYCGLLSLKPLKPVESPQQLKIKTSRSPLLARRGVTGSSSPQLQKKGTSPQSTRKGTSSPKVVKKTGEAGESTPTTKHKAVEVPKPVRMR
uniref:non-specific serine/threonine protein kinase n=1 Tax=Cyprinus carpio TaxID=7962 RepID=A0A8C2J494_CYPCA